VTTIVAESSTFSAGSLTSCVKEVTTGSDIVIDLSRCRFVTPAGLVFLGVMMSMAQARGLGCSLTFEACSDFAKYADRMGLSTHAARCGVNHQRFPTVRRHNAQHRFVELTEINDVAQQMVAEDISNTIIARNRDGGWGADTHRLYSASFELATNVEFHALTPGLAMVQHFPNQNEVEFAFGDHGQGIRASLAGGGHDTEDDGAAIRLAVDTPASATGDPMRGKGLTGLRDSVCGPKLRGWAIVQSGSHQVTYSHGQPPITTTLTYRSPGTFVFGRIRTD
jgi:hypothetical protein